MQQSIPPKIMCVIVSALIFTLVSSCSSPSTYLQDKADHERHVNIQKYRISFSGGSGRHTLNSSQEIYDLPPESKKAALAWAAVLSGMAGHYWQAYDSVEKAQFRFDEFGSSRLAMALPIYRARKEWQWAVVQDVLLRLEAYGYTAKVEWLNAQGRVLAEISTAQASPEPSLQSVTDPLKYQQKTWDIERATFPMPD